MSPGISINLLLESEFDHFRNTDIIPGGILCLSGCANRGGIQLLFEVVFYASFQPDEAW